MLSQTKRPSCWRSFNPIHRCWCSPGTEKWIVLAYSSKTELVIKWKKCPNQTFYGYLLTSRCRWFVWEYRRWVFMWSMFPGYREMFWLYQSQNTTTKIEVLRYWHNVSRMVPKLFTWSFTMCTSQQYHIRKKSTLCWCSPRLYTGTFVVFTLC